MLAELSVVKKLLSANPSYSLSTGCDLGDSRGSDECWGEDSNTSITLLKPVYNCSARKELNVTYTFPVIWSS